MLNAGYVRRCAALIRGDPASTERDVNHNNETPDSTRDINPSCLTRAHRLLRDDRDAGMFRLGLSAPLADLLPTLTRARMPSPLDDANFISIPWPACSDTRAYPMSDRGRIAGALTWRRRDESEVLS
ncbi:hypothetical protein WL77_06935 [Burkholderia ubonensis]|uniref:flagellar transcriptional regulator FlhD n=1 Tax=Burkholderia ubonensis TaxID=101571 RepID=UPI000757F62B|nr:flagellar transcriptional regulator FlhD [Burkholderia ubonensis]KWE73212.1 hypothetical protein WL79_17085 [Burkholderia ubonensis]KWE73982.1 hypothetical protein WL77_06935 [Burkholderia ubonensis]